MSIKQSLIRILELLLGKNEFPEFRDAIKERESNNNYQAKNSLGYLGAYQFGMARLCDLGLTERLEGHSGYGNDDFKWKEGKSEELFLQSENVQDLIFFRHVTELAGRLNKQFNNYIGKEVFGVKITLSGLIAGAHLGGVGAVNDFIQTGKSAKDDYGTSVKSYIEDFQGYNLKKLI